VRPQALQNKRERNQDQRSAGHEGFTRRMRPEHDQQGGHSGDQGDQQGL